MKKRNITLASVAAAVCLLCVSSATAQNLIVNGDFSSGNLTGWTAAPTAPTTITYDGAEGNPIGSALLARNNTAADANANYLYQVIPVTPGQQYKLDADWKGDLLNGGTGRNWAEVFVSFASSPSATPANIVYKKATDGGPNDVPMPWGWESILLSADGGPADGVFSATDNYMVVGFNLGGRAGVGPGYYNLDNVSVTPWPPSSEPVFTNIMLEGGDVILQGTNGPSRGAYEMLRSADLAQSLSNWPGVGIDSFDFDGDFSFTNTLPGDEASFYGLRVVSAVPVNPVVITAQPQDLATSVGDTANFSVTADGTAPLTYRWYFNTNTLLTSGSSATLSLPNVQLTNSGKISVTVSNLLGAVPSDFATLTVTNNTQPPSILTQPQDETAFVGQTANFSVTAEGALPLHYQWYYNTNTVLAGKTGTTLTLNDVQLTNAGMYSVTVTNLFGSSNSVFAELTVNTNSSSGLIGWASVAGAGLTTTTGGGDATPQTVTDLATLRSLAGDGTPRVLLLSGTFVTGDSAVEIASNKTLRGVDQNATIQGGINISEGRSNIIVQNLHIQANGSGNRPYDAAAARSSHHLWFDHVTFSDASDGCLDLTIASDFITVSWCKFFYTGITTDHRLCSLVGNSSNSTGDTGHNNVTYHHNWFSALVDQRMPRLLFGKGHFFNNYYYAPGNSYCIGTGSWASALIENNYFKQVNSPHKFQDTNPSYIAAPPGNIYDNTSGSQNTGLGFPDNDGNDPGPWNPSDYYPYTLDAAADVPVIVTLGAGPQ